MSITRTIISCVGDDLTEALTDSTGLGWVYRVQERFEILPCMFNFAVSGETTNQIYSRMSAELFLHNAEEVAEYMILSAGTIDCMVKEIFKSGIEVVWECKMLPLLTKMVKIGTIPIILTIPLYNSGQIDHEFGTKLNKIKWYNNFLREFGKKYSFKVIDLENLWHENEFSEYLKDEFHLNAKGYKLLADKLFIELSDYLKIHLQPLE